MEFHGTWTAPVSLTRAVPWNSMEFHGTWSAPISLTRAVPWNSMELGVRHFRWHEHFHVVHGTWSAPISWFCQINAYFGALKNIGWLTKRGPVKWIHIPPCCWCVPVGWYARGRRISNTAWIRCWFGLELFCKRAVQPSSIWNQAVDYCTDSVLLWGCTPLSVWGLQWMWMWKVLQKKWAPL